MHPDLRVCLFGPVQARLAERPLVITARLQRAVLAYLALHAGHVVSTGGLVDAIWGEDPPKTVGSALQVYVSGLRRALGPASGALVTRPPGYLLDLDPSQVDVLAFEAQVRAAREEGITPPEPPADGGGVLSDLIDLPFAGPVIAHLEELRWSCLEERVEADLANGRHAALVPDLEVMLTAQPYRERLWRALMIALYRSGRQADALRAYRRAADVLADELGVDPGPALVAVQRAVLAGDPELLPQIRPAVTSRLPEPAGPLIGRDTEAAALAAAIEASRLVTVTGPGGVGKTALALRAVGDLVAARPEIAAALVDLSTGAEGTDLLVTIAADLGAPIEAGSAQAAIAAHLGDRPFVLILDTVDRARSQKGVLAGLLTACPGLRLLLTGRAALGIPGEQVVPLGPLGEQAAVRLFLDRMTPSGLPSGGSGTGSGGGGSSDAPSSGRSGTVIGALCARLDGLPLALELAAARCRAMEPAVLLGQLEQRLSALDTHGADRTDRIERHRTIAATVRWSIDLLGPAPRRLFGRLGMTAGSLTFDDLITVTGSTPAQLSGDLAALVDAGLIALSDGRYRMLGLLRAAARDLVAELGELDEATAAHRHWAISRTAASAARLAGEGETEELAELIELLPDLRLAARAAIRDSSTGDPHAAAAAEAGARIVIDARRAWFSVARLTELAELLDAALSAGVSAVTAAQARGLLAVVRKISGHAGAPELTDAAVSLRTVLGLPDAADEAYGADDADGSDGAEAAATSITMLVNVLCHEAANLSEAGDERAVDVAAEAVRMAERSRDPNDVAMALDLSGYVARNLDRADLAVDLARRAVARSSGTQFQLSLGLAGLCAALAAAGRVDEALDPAMEAVARVRSSGAAVAHAEVITQVTCAVGTAGMSVLAPELTPALATMIALGNRPSAAELVRAVAVTAGDTGQPEAAATLLGAADRLATTPGEVPQRRELVDRLGPAGFARARAAGTVLGEDDLVRLVEELAAGWSTG